MDPWTVALVLLLSPHAPELPQYQPPENGEQLPASAEFEAFRDVCHLMEIWRRADSWNDDYAGEVYWCRARWQQAQLSPPLEHSGQLPNEDDAWAKYQFANTQVHLLETWASVYPQRNLHLAIPEARRQRHAWQLIKTATNSCELKCARRIAMMELGGLIGWQDFYAGRWPPHVPLYLFRTEP
jgi:hypothetical protein